MADWNEEENHEFFMNFDSNSNQLYPLISDSLSPMHHHMANPTEDP